MKKLHIVALIGIAASLMVILTFVGDLSTYETLASARQKEGKTVTVVTQLDHSMEDPIIYDPAKNANLTTFYVVDTLGNKAKVHYYFEKPFDMEKSDRIVLKGKMQNGVFEITRKDGILMKCPSKYKDNPNATYETLTQNVN